MLPQTQKFMIRYSHAVRHFPNSSPPFTCDGVGIWSLTVWVFSRPLLDNKGPLDRIVPVAQVYKHAKKASSFLDIVTFVNTNLTEES